MRWGSFSRKEGRKSILWFPVLIASPRPDRELQQEFVTGFVAALFFFQCHLYNLLPSSAGVAVSDLPFAWSLLLLYQPEESLVCPKTVCAALTGHHPVPASLSATGENWLKRVVHGENPLCSFGKQGQRCILIPWTPPEAQAKDSQTRYQSLGPGRQCLKWPGNGILWEITLKTLKKANKGMLKVVTIKVDTSS